MFCYWCFWGIYMTYNIFDSIWQFHFLSVACSVGGQGWGSDFWQLMVWGLHLLWTWHLIFTKKWFYYMNFFHVPLNNIPPSWLVAAQSTRILHSFMNCYLCQVKWLFLSCSIVTLLTMVHRHFMNCFFVLSKITLWSCLMVKLHGYFTPSWTTLLCLLRALFKAGLRSHCLH